MWVRGRGGSFPRSPPLPTAGAARSPAAAELSMISSGARPPPPRPPPPAGTPPRHTAPAPPRPLAHAPSHARTPTHPPAQGPGVRPRCSTAQAAAPPPAGRPTRPPGKVTPPPPPRSPPRGGRRRDAGRAVGPRHAGGRGTPPAAGLRRGGRRREGAAGREDGFPRAPRAGRRALAPRRPAAPSAGGCAPRRQRRRHACPRPSSLRGAAPARAAGAEVGGGGAEGPPGPGVARWPGSSGAAAGGGGFPDSGGRPAGFPVRPPRARPRGGERRSPAGQGGGAELSGPERPEGRVAVAGGWVLFYSACHSIKKNNNHPTVK